jgi:hypothetical protein
VIEGSWFDFHLKQDNFALTLYLHKMYLNVIIPYTPRLKNLKKIKYVFTNMLSPHTKRLFLPMGSKIVITDVSDTPVLVYLETYSKILSVKLFL